MADLINLRIARKQSKRRHAEQAAAASRLVHGRSKAQQANEQLRRAKDDKSLDQHRIETDQKE